MQHHGVILFDLVVLTMSFKILSGQKIVDSKINVLLISSAVAISLGKFNPGTSVMVFFREKFCGAIL